MINLKIFLSCTTAIIPDDINVYQSLFPPFLCAMCVFVCVCVLVSIYVYIYTTCIFQIGCLLLCTRLPQLWNLLSLLSDVLWNWCLQPFCSRWRESMLLSLQSLQPHVSSGGFGMVLTTVSPSIYHMLYTNIDKVRIIVTTHLFWTPVNNSSFPTTSAVTCLAGTASTNFLTACSPIQDNTFPQPVSI